MGSEGAKRVAIVAAMPGELLHLARGWKHEKREGGVHLWRTSQGDAEWVAACAGAGQAAATRAFAEVEKDGPLTAVISTGWVGALTAEFAPGRVYAVAGVIDAQTGERFAAEEAVLANGGLPPEHASWRTPAGKAGKAAAATEKKPVSCEGPGQIPSGAKAHIDSAVINGTAEAVPLQNAPGADRKAKVARSGADAVPLQNAPGADRKAEEARSGAEAVPLQNAPGGGSIRSSAAAPAQVRPWVVTGSKVADLEEKRRLAGAYPAGLVDMESAAVARLASMRGIPFYCIKGVSDGHTSRLPDFNRFLTSQGQFRLAGFIFFALFRPWYWPELMRMSENSSKASQALRDSVLEHLRRPGAH